MRTIKNLNMNIVKEGIGFNRREDLDFTDDGNRFRGFDYKGLHISTLRSGDKTYLTIDPWYSFEEKTFTYRDWRKTEEYDLCDAFNGVGYIDLDILINNCERIIAKVNELELVAINEDFDMTGVLGTLTAERAGIEALLEKSKDTLKWWKLDRWSFTRAKSAYESFLSDLERIDKMISEIKSGEMSKARKRYYYQKWQERDYLVYEGEGSYYARTLLGEDC